MALFGGIKGVMSKPIAGAALADRKAAPAATPTPAGRGLIGRGGLVGRVASAVTQPEAQAAPAGPAKRGFGSILARFARRK